MILPGGARVLIALAVLAGAAGGGWMARGWLADRETAESAAVIATARETAMHGALVETTRRLTAQQEAADAAEKLARRARADAAAAGAAAGRLRDYAADLAARAGACDPAAAAVGPAASAPAVVLADMLGRLEARGRELADEATRRGIVADECAARYDALTP